MYLLGHHTAGTQISIVLALHEMTPATAAFISYHYILFKARNGDYLSFCIMLQTYSFFQKELEAI